MTISVKQNKFFAYMILLIVFIGYLFITVGRTQGSIVAAYQPKDYSDDFINDVKIFDVNSNEINRVPVGNPFVVRYQWSIPDNIEPRVQEGDSMTIHLPEQLRTFVPMSFSLFDSGGNQLGVANLMGNSSEVKVTFNDYPSKHSKVSGFLQFSVRYTAEQNQDDQQVALKFLKLNGVITKEVTVPGRGIPGEVDPPKEGAQTSKNGFYDRSNPELLDYVVRLNAENGVIKNGRYVDRLGEGHILVQDSIKITKGVFLNNGALKSGTITTICDHSVITDEIVELKTDSNGFEISFTDKALENTGVYIEYKTMQYEIRNSYGNTGILTGNGFETVRLSEEIKSIWGEGGGEGLTGSLELVKVNDAHDFLSGAEFSLFRIVNGAEILVDDTFRTDDEGKLFKDRLLYGEYKLVEVTSPEGHVLDATPRFFTIDENNKTEKIEFLNEKLKKPKGNFELIKVEANNESIKLAEAYFQLYKGRNTSGEKIDGEKKTGENGKVNWDNLDLGWYTVKELAAPSGYAIVDGGTYTFELTEGNYEKIMTYTMGNKKIPNPSIHTFAFETVSYAQNITNVLELRDIENKEIQPTENVGISDRVTYQNLSIGESYTLKATLMPKNENAPPLAIGTKIFVALSSNGEIVVNLNPFNARQFAEQQAVVFEELYNSSNQLVASHKDLTSEPQTISFKIPEGGAWFKKVGGDNLSGLAGAEFKLYKGVPGGLDIEYNSDVYTSNDQGIIKVSSLAYDNYYFKEVKAPSGYDLNDTPIPFTIDSLEDKDVTPGSGFVNTLTPDPTGGVYFHKIDNENGAPLQGAVFHLYKGLNGDVREDDVDYRSDSNGKVSTTQLLFGDYHFKEASAPSGYNRNNQVIPFTIDSEEDKDLRVNFINEKQRNPKINTFAFETGTQNNKELLPSQSVQITDKVTYADVVPKRNYVLKADLLSVPDGIVLAKGERRFTTQTSEGTVDVSLNSFDGSTLAGKKVVVMEYLYDETGKKLAEHVALDDLDQTVSFKIPRIETVAFVTGSSSDKKEDLFPHQNVNISDRVTYTNLNKGQVYTLEASLVDQKYGKQIVTSGKKEFVPSGNTGYVLVELKGFDARSFKGRKLVVYELLKDASGREVARHTDLANASQTISFVTSEIGTTAREKETGEQKIFPGNATIVDEVRYTNLDPTKEYTLEGILMDQKTAEPLLINGKEISAQKNFTPENNNGVVEINFNVDTSKLNGQKFVVFETLILEGAEVATHTDINDPDQTIEVMDLSIGTTLIDKETGTQTPSPEKEVTLVDTVEYKNLIPDRQYTLKGLLMDKVTEKPLFINEKKVEGETLFTPETPNGTVDVVFTFKAKDLANREVVAFEYLYMNGQEITAHTNIEDDNQTVHFKKPTIQTIAVGSTGEKEIEAKGTVKIIDKVIYSDLMIGKEYVIKGKLMDKATKEPLVIGGKEVVGEATFVTKKTDGQVEVIFQVDAKGLGNKQVVVFENLYKNEKHVFAHEDIDDETQTVAFIKQAQAVPNTSTTPLETANSLPSTGEKLNSLILFVGMLLFSVWIYFIVWRKVKG